MRQLRRHQLRARPRPAPARRVGSARLSLMPAPAADDRRDQQQRARPEARQRRAADRRMAAHRAIPARRSASSRNRGRASQRENGPRWRARSRSAMAQHDNDSAMMPATGWSPRSQRAIASAIASDGTVTTAQAGPDRTLEKNRGSSAAQNTTASTRAPAAPSARSQIDPGRAPPGRRHRGQQRPHRSWRYAPRQPCRGGREQRRADASAAPRRRRTALRQSAKVSKTAAKVAPSSEGSAIGPDRRAFGVLKTRPRRPAANRCRLACCCAPRPESGCAENRRSPASAASPGQIAPRRGRAAVSLQCPADRGGGTSSRSSA